MKALLLLVFVVVASSGSLVQSLRHQTAQPKPAAALAPHAYEPFTTHVVQSAEAGHVEEVLAWPGADVTKGQILARLSVVQTTPELRQRQQALRQAEAAYASQPTAAHAQAVEAARTKLNAMPRYERVAYVVAPVAGRVVRSLVVSGQYLPKAGPVAVIEAPDKKKAP
jgi:biotin carboxyl carrier protein